MTEPTGFLSQCQQEIEVHRRVRLRRKIFSALVHRLSSGGIVPVNPLLSIDYIHKREIRSVYMNICICKGRNAPNRVVERCFAKESVRYDVFSHRNDSKSRWKRKATMPKEEIREKSFNQTYRIRRVPLGPTGWQMSVLFHSVGFGLRMLFDTIIFFNFLETKYVN